MIAIILDGVLFVALLATVATLFIYVLTRSEVGGGRSHPERSEGGIPKGMPPSCC